MASSRSAALARAAAAIGLMVVVVVVVGPASANGPGVGRFACTGTEPFWALKMDGGSAALTRPIGPGGSIEEEAFRGTLRHLAALDPPWAVWRGRGASDPSRTLVATLRAEICRGAAGDRLTYDHRVVVSFPGGAAETGCCRAVAACAVEGQAAADEC